MTLAPIPFELRREFVAAAPPRRPRAQAKARGKQLGDPRAPEALKLANADRATEKPAQHVLVLITAWGHVRHGVSRGGPRAEPAEYPLLALMSPIVPISGWVVPSTAALVASRRRQAGKGAADCFGFRMKVQTEPCSRPSICKNLWPVPQPHRDNVVPKLASVETENV
jgi:hypothetical protein